MLKALKQALEDFKAALRTGQSDKGPEVEGEALHKGLTLGERTEGGEQAWEETEGSTDSLTEATVQTRPEEVSPEDSQDTQGKEDEEGEEDEDTGRSDGRSSRVKRILVVIGAIGIIWFVWQNLGSWIWPEPADKSVVATYSDGTVTKEELLATLDSHPEQERRALATPDGLRHLVQDIAVHRVVESWAKERQLDEKNNVQHAMKHVAEEINLHDIGAQIHQSQIRVDEADIQRYYEENRERMGNRPLAEVRDSIKETLHASKEKDYIDNYMRDLRARASVTVDYQLLAVPEPTEEELNTYYMARQPDFREPERVRVQEMRFEASSKDKEQEAVQKAEKALARVQAGEDFALVAQELAGPNPDAQGASREFARGARGPEFDEKILPLREGEVGPVFKEGDSYRVAKVVERRRERTRTFEEVREEIRRKLAEEGATAVYAGNKEKTLFTIRGRRFTVGEFLDEYQNFPPDVQARYRDFEAKKELVDRLIERLLVLDSASSQMLDVKNKKEIEEARRHVLAEILHQEEVQGKLQASDDEVKKFYDQHRSHYVEPPRVKISYIRVGMGLSEDSRKKARERIDEAAKRLQSAKDRPDAFAEVAKEFSEDPETAAKGGELDRWMTRQDDSLSHALAHDFTERVFNLKAGETSPVIAMGDSYYIVRVREKQEAKPIAFEQAKSMAREDLLAEKHDRALQDMEAELARRMKLVVYDSRVAELSKEIRGTSVNPSAGSGGQISPPSAGGGQINPPAASEGQIDPHIGH